MHQPFNATFTNFHEKAIALHTTDAPFHLFADQGLG